MPLYTYTAWDEDAVPHSGAIPAASVQDARRKLKRMGLYVTSLVGPGPAPIAALLKLLIGRKAAQTSPPENAQ